MKHFFRTLAIAVAVAAAASFTADARKKKDLVQTYPALEAYFSTPVEDTVQPDDKGFIRRWLLLEPISKPNRTNTVFVDSYLRANLDTGWNKGDFEVPADGQVEKMDVEFQAPVDMSAGRPRNPFEAPEIKIVKAKLTWHALDSKLFNVKLKAKQYIFSFFCAFFGEDDFHNTVLNLNGRVNSENFNDCVSGHISGGGNCGTDNVVTVSTVASVTFNHKP